jgi:hypothetical protein
VKRYYECLRALTDCQIHNEYMKAHPEEFDQSPEAKRQEELPE